MLDEDYSGCCPICLADDSGAAIQNSIFDRYDSKYLAHWQCGTVQMHESNEIVQGSRCISSDLPATQKRLAWLVRRTRRSAVLRMGEWKVAAYLDRSLKEIEGLIPTTVHTGE